MEHSCPLLFAIRASIKWWVGVCLLLILSFQSIQAQPDDRTSSPREDQVSRPTSIKVVMDDNYPPYIFRRSDGELQGILKDSWELWAKKTGITVQLHATDWGVAQQLMYTGQADVMDTAFRTAQREKLVDFSDPYEALDTVIFFHKSISGIKNVSDLRGFAVGVKDGGATTAWLESQGVSNLRKYPSYESIIKAAGKDEIRVFCMEKVPALYFLYKNSQGNEFRHSETLYTGQFHWGTQKGNKALHRIVAQGFAQITPDERKVIHDRWKGASLQERPEQRYAKIIMYVLLMVIAAASVLGLLNWTLRRKVRSKTVELSTALDALRTSERYNRMLFESTTVGLRLSKLDGSIVDANQAFADIIGYTLQETMQLSVQKINAPGYDAQDLFYLQNLMETGEYGPYDKVYIKKNGERVQVRTIGTLIERAGERYVLSSIEDITAQRATEEKINFLAFHDSLTSLPNRMYAQERFVQAVAQAERDRSKVALLLLDLDNFKNINDSLGHVAGDALLRAVSVRLQGCLQDNATISRQGGDEFLIVLPGLRDADAVAKILTNLMIRMQESFAVEGNELTTSVSAGVAIYPDDGEDFETLMRNADIAMYQAKDSGRNGFCFFDEEMHRKAFERLSLGSRLWRALDRNELQLYYQPLIDLSSGKIFGVEALLRWNHPELGIIAPGRFISLAEDTGMIVPIGEWVLHEACRQAAEWHRNGHPNLQIAVNLSAAQFRRRDLEKTVMSALEQSKIDPTLLELELTETILLTDAENTLETVRRLKALGVKLSIDDFGTGYSSLSYLKRFAVNKLKIDQSFVRNVTTDPDDAAIVRAIIQMAKSLGLKTIAEGVEESETLEWLRLYHCDEAQGYYFAKPMIVEKFEEYARPQAQNEILQ